MPSIVATQLDTDPGSQHQPITPVNHTAQITPVNSVWRSWPFSSCSAEDVGLALGSVGLVVR
ncbi:MAG: hypothetical protein ABF792_06400, partial [Bifidobacterium psychraerophilum]|uniref:hypothetical protein n=1 Tax=Bifidobacterium psychraerophilum TaxID=218140 RepID=UPI0039E82171